MSKKKIREEVDDDIKEELDKADSHRDKVLLLLANILRELKKLNTPGQGNDPR